jgi:hypothetical protein
MCKTGRDLLTQTQADSVQGQLMLSISFLSVHCITREANQLNITIKTAMISFFIFKLKIAC